MDHLQTPIKFEDGTIVAEDPVEYVVPMVKQLTMIPLNQLVVKYNTTTHGMYCLPQHIRPLVQTYFETAASQLLRTEIGSTPAAKGNSRWELPSSLLPHALLLCFQGLDRWPDFFAHLLVSSSQSMMMQRSDRETFIALLVNLDGFLPGCSTSELVANISSASSCSFGVHNKPALLPIIDFTKLQSDNSSVTRSLTPLNLFLYSLVSADNGFTTRHGYQFSCSQPSFNVPHPPNCAKYGVLTATIMEVATLYAAVCNESHVVSLITTGGYAHKSAADIVTEGFLGVAIRDGVMAILTSATVVREYASVLPHVQWLQLAHLLTRHTRDGLGMPCSADFKPEVSPFTALGPLQKARLASLCGQAQKFHNPKPEESASIPELAKHFLKILGSNNINCDKDFIDAMSQKGADDMIGTVGGFRAEIAAAAATPQLIQLLQISAADDRVGLYPQHLYMSSPTPFLRCYIPGIARMDAAFVKSYLRFLRDHRGVGFFMSEDLIEATSNTMANVLAIKQEPD